MARSFADAVASSSRSGGGRRVGRGAGGAAGGGSDPTRELVASIARLRLAGGASAAEADRLLETYGPEIDPELLKQYGMEAPSGGGGFLDKAKRLGKGALSTGLDIINRPSQAALQAVQAGFYGGSWDDAAYALYGAYQRTDEQGWLNLRAATGRDPQGGGRLAGFFDFVGTVAIDPINFITAGARPLAETGLSIAARDLSPEVAATIRSQGLRALDDESLDAFRAAITASPEAQRAIIRRQGLQRVGLRPFEEGTDEFANRVIEQTARSGRGGIRIAGFTAVSGEQITAGRRALGFTDETADLVNRARNLPGRALTKATAGTRQSLRKAFSPRAGLAGAVGEEAARQVRQLGVESGAFAQGMGEDLVQRLGARAAEANIDDELRGVIRTAIETGDVDNVAAGLRAEGRDAAADLLEEVDLVVRETTEANVRIGALRANEDIDAVRLGGQMKAAEKMVLKEEKRAATIGERAAKQRARADELEAAAADLKLELAAARKGAGRAKSFGEGEKLGRARARAARLEAEATVLENAARRADEALPGVREKAFREAAQAAEQRVAKAATTRDEAFRLLAEAEDDVREQASKLSAAAADGKKITDSMVRKLGRLEGEAAALRRQANSLAAAARGAEKAGARSLSKLAAKDFSTEGIANTDELVSAAVAARRKADAALDQAEELRATIEVVARTADGKATFAQGQRFGIAQSRATAARREAVRLEKRLAKAKDRVENILTTERAIKRVTKAGEDAVARAAKQTAFAKNDYLSRFITDDARKQLMEMKGVAADGLRRELGMGQIALRQEGKLQSRQLWPDLSIDDVNAKIADEYGIENFFETDPLKIVTLRGLQVARAEASFRMLHGLTKVVDEAGTPLVLMGDEVAALAADKGYIATRFPTIEGDVFVAPEVATELNRMTAVVYNDVSLAGWQQFTDKWGALWAGYATVPVMFGTGFFARNTMGNLFNNFLAGVRTSSYGRAMQAQVAIHRAIKETKRTIGPEFEAALRKLTGDADAILEARRMGVMNEGFFSADLSDDVIDRLAGQGSIAGKLKAGDTKAALREFNPLNRHNILLEPGAKLNRIIEDNSRLAHFLSKADELGSAERAASSVRKYLFDYNDLTTFERYRIRNVVRFYTYMRKNTPLMISSLAHQPGKFTALVRSPQAFMSGDVEGPVPQYALAAGGLPISDGTLFSIDTPFSSAMQTLQPALQAAALVPGVKEFLPESLRPEEGVSEVARSLLNMPSGGPVEMLKFLGQEAMREELFTGREIKDQSGTAVLSRFTKALAPIYSKGESTITKLSDPERRMAGVITAITGIRVLQVTEGAQTSEMYRQLELAQRAIDQARAEGIDLPTIKELQDAGILPPPVRAPRAPRRSPGQRRTEALASLEAKGVQVPQPAG